MEGKGNQKGFGKESKGFFVFVVIFIVAMVSLAFGSAYNVFLKNKTVLLNKENNVLRMQMDALTEEIKILTRKSSRKPKDGWKRYLPTPNEVALVGKTKRETEDILGKPATLMIESAVNFEEEREVWVYHPYETDSTGLYIYLKGGKVVNGFLDEFNGLDNPNIWAEEKFKLNEKSIQKNSKKSLLEYYKDKEVLSSVEKTKEFAGKSPEELGFNEVSKTKITCPEDIDGPCGGDLLILADQFLHVGEQEFYLAIPGGAGYDYYGPFEDNLEAIVEESKLFVVYKEPGTDVVRLTPVVEYNPVLKSVPFEIVASGAYSAHREAEYYKIENNKDWEDLWGTVYANVKPQPELPEIDFDKKTIIAVFEGEFSSGGYSVGIDEISETKKNVKVVVKLEMPGERCATTTAFTQPFTIVKIDKNNKEASFEKNKSKVSCQ